MSRASNSLSRRSAVQQSSRPSLRERSAGRASLAPSNLSPEVEALSAAYTPEVSPTQSLISTRKSRLVTKLTERDEAERKDRERELRKALLKEKRDTAANLKQVRHAASEQASKVNRNNVEIKKVKAELERLNKWRQAHIDRLQVLMRQLVEEQNQIEEEFLKKHSEADDMRSTFELEQSHLEADLRVKDDEVHQVEFQLKRVEEDLKRLDDGIGVAWNGGFQNLLDEGSFMSKGLTDDGASVSSYNRLENFAPPNAGSLRAGDNSKVVPRSEVRPVPAPITASRKNSKDSAAAAEPNGVAEKQRQQTPQRSQSSQPATASNAGQAAPKAAAVNSAVVRNPDVSPLRARGPGQQPVVVSGSAVSSSTFATSANSSATAPSGAATPMRARPAGPTAGSARVASAGPTPVRTAPSASANSSASVPSAGAAPANSSARVPSAGATASRTAPTGGYPAVARQAPQADPRLLQQQQQQQPYPQAAMPMRNANVRGMPGPAGASGLSNWSM